MNTQGLVRVTVNMKGYKTAIIALHCAAAVCAIIVIGITGDTLAAINKASRQVEQVLRQQQQLMQQVMQYHQDFTGNTEVMMQPVQAAAMRNGPETSRLGFLMFVALAGLLLDGFLVALQLLPRLHDATLGVLTRRSSAAWLQRPFSEVLMSALWSVMWLAGAAAVSHLLEGASDCAGGKACDLANALMAFSWLAWLLWCAATALMAWTWSRALGTAPAAATSQSAGAGIVERPAAAAVPAACLQRVVGLKQ